MTEQDARALLVAEYRADNHPHYSRVLRWPLDALPYSDRVAIRAMLAGARQDSAGAGGEALDDTGILDLVHKHLRFMAEGDVIHILGHAELAQAIAARSAMAPAGDRA